MNAIIESFDKFARWALRGLAVMRTFGAFKPKKGEEDKVGIDDYIQIFLEFYLTIHPEVVKVSKQFTKNTLEEEIKLHPELLVEIVESEPHAAARRLGEVVDDRVTLMVSPDIKTIPEPSFPAHSDKVIKELLEKSQVIVDTTPEKKEERKDIEKLKMENFLKTGSYELPAGII